MPTFLITCKMDFMRLGITSIIRDLFPGAVSLYAGGRQECLRILRNERITLMISDETVSKGHSQGMVREVRALQPDIKIIMLLEPTRINQANSLCPPGEIDTCIRKNAPIEQVHDAILHALSGTEA